VIGRKLFRIFQIIPHLITNTDYLAYTNIIITKRTAKLNEIKMATV